MAYAVRALWDFSAGNGDELSFITGDILQVTNSADPDWWEAVDANGNRGLIPANRVETLSAQELSLLQYPVQVTAVNVAEGQEATASAVYRITGVIRGTPFSVMKSVSSLDGLCVELAKHPDSSLFSPETVYLIRSESRASAAEAAVRELIAELAFSTLYEHLESWVNAGDELTVPDVGEYHVVIHNWEAENPDDLELVLGEEILVIQQHDHGWWYGKRPNGARGFFPRNYVQPVRPQVPRRGSGVMAAPPPKPAPAPSPAPPPASRPQPALPTGRTGQPRRDSSSGSGGGRARPFSIRSLEAFDRLMDQGYSVEFPEDSPGPSGNAPADGMRVEVNCRAMTWDGAHTSTNPFADTHDDQPLCFTLGAGQVTQGLEAGIRSLTVGQRARITCTPKMAYGDAGNPPHVPPHSHVVYEVELLSCEYEELQRAATGPSTLLGSGLSNRQEKSRDVYSARISRRVMLDPSSLKGMKPSQGTSGTSNEELLQRAAATMGIGNTQTPQPRASPPPTGGGAAAAAAGARGAANGRTSLRMTNLKEQMAAMQAEQAAASAAPPAPQHAAPRPPAPTGRPQPPSRPPAPAPAPAHAPPPAAAAARPPARAKPAPPSAKPAAAGPSATYPLEQLQNPPFPEGVDSTQREVYLSDDDFMAVFGMDRRVFTSLPKWKQANLKKQHNLF